MNVICIYICYVCIHVHIYIYIGNSKTFFVANISAESAAHSETVSTLKFASFASKSQLLVSRNQVNKEPDVDELKVANVFLMCGERVSNVWLTCC
jgi:hypothetical protein